MNLSDVEELKNYLRNSGLKPNDYLGQNFLVDEIALEEIISAADLKPTDTVIEVGPGLGVLTGELVKHAGRVIAVEKDRNLIPILKREFKKETNLEILEDDILKFHLDEHLSGDYKVVANIPYYLTTKLFQYFLEQQNRPKSLVLMVQKEVALRVVAPAGDLSILGISVQIFSDVEIVAVVPKKSFWPVPKVDSAILKITPRHKYPEITDEKFFFRIIKIAFAGKRKQIHNTLVSGLKLPKEQILKVLIEAGIDPSSRPQDLEISQWIRLCAEITKQT